MKRFRRFAFITAILMIAVPPQVGRAADGWAIPFVSFTSNFTPSKLDFLKFRAIHPKAFANYSGILEFAGSGTLPAVRISSLGFLSKTRTGDNYIEEDYRELPIEMGRVDLDKISVTFEEFNLRSLDGGVFKLRYNGQAAIPIRAQFSNVGGKGTFGRAQLLWGGQSIPFDHIEFNFREKSRDLLSISFYQKGKRVALFGTNGTTRLIEQPPSGPQGPATNSGSD